MALVAMTKTNPSGKVEWKSATVSGDTARPRSTSTRQVCGIDSSQLIHRSAR
jgi:hypothetical protein